MSQTTWTLPNNLLDQSLRIMRPHGVRGCEGLALWFGNELEDRVHITHVVEPYGPGFSTSPYHMELSVRAMATLTDLAEKLNVFLVGQIHSHPGTFIDLSGVDEREGIRVPGYLSLVCPHYGQIRRLKLENCGVHVFEGGTYRRLDWHETTRRIAIHTKPSIVVCQEVPA
jgi:proteasome lid subunit RPN8/RPN11